MHGKPQTITECFPNIQDFADMTRKHKRLSQMPFECKKKALSHAVGGLQLRKKQ